MKRLLSAAVICTFLFYCFLIFAGCRSDPATGSVDSEIEEGIREKSAAFSTAQTLLAEGTPAAIEEALDEISSAELGSTDRGAELLYTASGIYRIVYPYLTFPGEEVAELPDRSVFRQLFSAVEEGRAPEVPENEATFLTTMIATLAILTTEKEETVQEAAALSERLLSINPQSPLALFLRGYALERQGEGEEALRRYREVVEMAPSCYPARMGLVRMLLRLRREREALPQVKKLLEDFGAQREVLRLAVEVFLRMDELARADDLLSTALGRYPEDGVLLRKRAILLERTGRTEQARRIVRVVEQREGESAESLLVRVRLLAEQGRVGEALAEALDGVERYPDAPELQIELAGLLLVRGRPGDAREVLTSLRSDLPDNRRIRSLLLEALIAEERWQEARQQLDPLLNGDPGAELLSKAVQVYSALEERERALDFAERLVREYPWQPDAIERYVRLLLEMGRRQEAERYLAGRLEQAEDSAVMSQLYYLQSEVADSREEKIESLQSALFENMQNEKALIRIAELYEQNGEYKKAVRYLRQAVNLNPRDEELKQRLRRLERSAR